VSSMHIGGRWVESDRQSEIRNPYTGQVVDMVPNASGADAELALESAARGASAMGSLAGHERAAILNRAAELVEANGEQLARTITMEEGKPIVESRGETGRIPDLLRLCAHEGTQVRGEQLPLDAQAGVRGKLGLTMRVPYGVVLAITPYNYPLLLVVHKIGPALAAGNAVILKPAGRTPLSALLLTKLLLEAGLPAEGIQCITGAGGVLGPILATDRRVRKVTFTGSAIVGEALVRAAGPKSVSLELGSNCALVLLADADVEAAVAATVTGGYANAGQVCISTQRVIVQRERHDEFVETLAKRVAAIPQGDPLRDDTRLAAMISADEANRVGAWIDEAVAEGASVVTGNERSGATHAPTVVAGVRPGMRIEREELFGPAVAVLEVGSLEDAIASVNASDYGLSSAIFTADLTAALRFVTNVQTGMVMVNSSTLWRADLMPYGGMKQSGFGREGPRYAIDEMTQTKTIVFHGP